MKMKANNSWSKRFTNLIKTGVILTDSSNVR